MSALGQKQTSSGDTQNRQSFTALRAIYLDVVLVFGGGLIGTGHHWYFNGQSELNMASVQRWAPSP
jgi:hypothetical protein